MKNLFSILLLYLCLSPSAFSGPTDPNIRWRELHSQHFKVIYDETQKSLADVYLAAGEWAYSQLIPVFGESPNLPITVVLADQTDFANGAATFLPYQMISIYPVLPTANDTIDNYENWATDIMMHELTHIFNMAPAHGIYVPLKYIFGGIVRPNGILPRWYLEGLAVEMESRKTRAGRLRSPYLFGQWRALALSEKFRGETISHINESNISSYPFGQRPYLFGALLMHNIVEDAGLGVVADFNQRFSRRLPFLLNGPSKDATGLSWSERWEKLKITMADEAKQMQKATESGGIMSTSRLTSIKGHQNFPTLSPDGKHLAFLLGQPFENTSLQVLEIESGALVASTDTYGASHISWSPDGNKILFSQVHIWNRRRLVSDLFLWDFNQKNAVPTPVTVGWRAEDGELSPNAQKIIFTQNENGKTNLILLNTQKSKYEPLLTPRVGSRISSPTWLSNEVVAFVGRDLSGTDRIYQMNLKSKKRTVIYESKGKIANLRQTTRGLLVSDSFTGIFNLYLLKKGQPPEALTNSQTAALSGSIDEARGRLIFAQVTEEGTQIVATSLTVFHPPEIGPPRYATFQEPPPHPVHLSALKSHEDNYSPWPYLVPQYWSPFFYPVEGGLLIQGSTESIDPTQRHGINLLATYDTVTRQTSYGIKYINSTTPADIGISVAESNELISADSDPITNRFYNLSTSFYLPNLSNAWRMNLGTVKIYTELPNKTSTQQFERLGAQTSLSYQSSAATLLPSPLGSTFFNISNVNYLPGQHQLAFNRMSGAFGFNLKGPFPPRHNLSFQMKASHAPQLPIGKISNFGDRTIGGNYLVSLINSNYLLRGYPSGALAGRSLVNTNLEYHFPLLDIDSGYGTFPLFLRNVDTALVFDAAAVDGIYLSPTQNSFFRSQMGNIYAGSGVEFTLLTTMAYHLPVTMTLAYYYGFQEQAGGGSTLFLSFGYVGHGGVDDSSKRTERSRPDSFAW